MCQHNLPCSIVYAHCLLPGRAFASLYVLLFLEKEAEIGGREYGTLNFAQFRVKETKTTVVPTKSDNDVILCLQLQSKTLMCTLHFSIRESIDHLCITPILWIGLIHKRSINSMSLITL